MSLFARIVVTFSNFQKQKRNNYEPKKKRGRPPGSGKKVVIITETKNDLQSQVEAAMKKAGITPLIVTSPEKAKANEVVEFPKDWNTMGKVDKLKFLTEKLAK